MRKFVQPLTTGILMLLVVLLLSSSSALAAPHVRTYEVTITNLTTSGQWFTPPVVATHSRGVHIFQPRQAASFELKEIAENGNLDPLIAALSADPKVYEVVVAVAGDPPPLAPQGSVTFEISAADGAKFLSFASMLICTNDGFTGVDSLRLPRYRGQTVRSAAIAYDAGTEINTEDFADIVPPCPVLSGVESSDEGSGTSDPALAEGRKIHRHRGIAGIDDLLPEVHGWSNPVVRIEVTRTD